MPYQSQSEKNMDKFEQIKMIELVKVEDPDADGGITLVFQENKTLKIKIVDGKLVSEFI
ncbi:conserved hypothetical protein [metagenome]